MGVKWRKVCASSVFPVVPAGWVRPGDGTGATSDWVSAVGDSREALGGEAVEEADDPKLAMFKGHVLNIAKAAGVDGEEFVEWLTGMI